MPSIELRIANQKFVVKGDDADTHLDEVEALVQAKIDALLREHPSMTAPKVALLAAVEFASQSIKGRHLMDDYRSTLISKAGDILDRLERELSPVSN